MTGNLRNSKMSIKVILIQEEQSNSLKSLKCYARTEVPGEPAANNENKSTSFHIPASLFFPLLLQSVKMDIACPSVCSTTLTHPPVTLNPTIQISFLPIYRNKMSSQKVSLQQIHRQRLNKAQAKSIKK